MRNLLFLFALMACDAPSNACRLADSRLACPECDDGVVTCSLDGVTVTEASCGGCQARAALYRGLCDAGSTATATEMTAEDVCDQAVLGAR